MNFVDNSSWRSSFLWERESVTEHVCWSISACDLYSEGTWFEFQQEHRVSDYFPTSSYTVCANSGTVPWIKWCSLFLRFFQFIGHCRPIIRRRLTNLSIYPSIHPSIYLYIIYLCIYLCIYLSVPIAPSYSLQHQWNSSFYFIFLILDSG
jgi:hypothetical protein